MHYDDTMRFWLILLALSASAQGPVQSDWPHHGGSQFAWRYSALDQIKTTNVKSLAVAWAFQTGDYGDSLQSTPIVIDGVMYVSTSYAQVFALNAATGRLIWRYKYPLSASVGRAGGERRQSVSGNAGQFSGGDRSENGPGAMECERRRLEPVRMQYHLGAVG